ncbi:hypothetical protein HMPREF3038_02350 [Akkermansia sp. KLE1797]|nr:hypothetical protein HMPREF3038_02350 [Akkermansia sp. KLE1797]KZA03927.1 hypothetical protein HMPREF1326_02467 [Akkermansia sp. KLE1605]
MHCGLPVRKGRICRLPRLWMGERGEAYPVAAGVTRPVDAAAIPHYACLTRRECLYTVSVACR